MEIKRPTIVTKEYCVHCGQVISSIGGDGTWYHLPDHRPYQDSNCARECKRPEDSHREVPHLMFRLSKQKIILKDFDDVDALLG